MNFVTSVKSLHHKMSLLLPLLSRGSSTQPSLRACEDRSMNLMEVRVMRATKRCCETTIHYIPKYLSVLQCCPAQRHCLPPHPPCTVLPLRSFTITYHTPSMEIWLPGATAELGFSPNWAVHSRQQTQIKAAQQHEQTWSQQKFGIVPQGSNKKLKTGEKS